jgi:hypothetical protein
LTTTIDHIAGKEGCCLQVVPFDGRIQKKGENLHTGKGLFRTSADFALYVRGSFRHISLEIVQKTEYKKSFDGSSEFLKSEWVCVIKKRKYFRYHKACTGKYSLCIPEKARTKSGCIAKLKLDISTISSQGFFSIIRFRTDLFKKSLQ